VPEIHVLGIPLTPEARALLDRADVVAGGRKNLHLAPPGARQIVIGKDLSLDAITSAEGQVCVLASGDPGFFGIVRALSTRAQVAVHPAPSSVALAFARLGLPWDDAIVVSAHGRDPRPAINTALRHPKVAILTEPAGAGRIVDALDGRIVTVAENLGTADERLAKEPPFNAPNVVVVHEPTNGRRATVWPPRTPTRWALGEQEFEHRQGMITKAEVRALVLAALGPGTGDMVWDVGAGSGSVAIECARLGAAATAIEQHPETVAKLLRNVAAHRVPVLVVSGHAPDALYDLPEPDAVFVGGGGTELPLILDHATFRARRVVVVTLALVDRIAPTLRALEQAGLEVTATTLQANRVKPIAGGHRLAAENPVTVISGRRLKLVAGIGCSLDCPPAELLHLIQSSLPAGRLAALATIDRRAEEPAMRYAAEQLEVPLLTYTAEQLAATPVPSPSDTVRRHVDTPSVAEAAAILSRTHLIVTKQRSEHATCAVAEWRE
jgi:precorrin-6Y C5,15-methyltransferase (decarboxylating)